MKGSTAFPILCLLILGLTAPTSTAEPKAFVNDLDAFHKQNLTKRPLNFYIIANAKHAVVENQTDYRLARPPFAIKQRGAVVLLHGETGRFVRCLERSCLGRSLDWHVGYPSLIQMMAASGHLTIAPELSTQQSLSLKLIEQIIHKENLSRIVFLADGKAAQLLIELVDNGELKDQLDGIVLLQPGDEINWKADRAVLVPTVLLGFSNSTEQDERSSASKNPKRLRLTTDGNVREYETVEKVTQIMVNFLDFIHPR